MFSLSDAELNRLRDGDPVLFTELVQYYHPRLVNFAGTYVGDRWSEEVVQDAWISVYKHLSGFAGRSQLSTWLYSIVRNAALSRLRKERRYRSLAEMARDENGGGAETWLESQFDERGRWLQAPQGWGTATAAAVLEEEELQSCIDRAIGRLSPLQQSVLIMRDQQQMALQDICNILEISYSNARVLLHRARLSVREAIELHLEGNECSVVGK
ncbi:MAG: RNA polymerase sigma factor [Pseudohongiellaceae bacterium]